jgi:TPR repeat protein
MIAGTMLCLLLVFAAQSAGAQTPEAVPGKAPTITNPVNTQEPIQGDKASDAKAVKAPAPIKAEAASGTKPAANPVSKKTASKKTAPKKPGKAPKAEAKAKKGSKSADGAKATPAPVKPAAKTKPKAAVKKPVATTGAGASKATPGTPAAAMPPQPAERNLLGMRQADARYQEGVELERRGDLRAAVAAYQQAGESGHGMAQKKLGDFYGTGNDVIERDYETSLRWYERARQQGIEIPKPFTYPGVRR